MVDLITTFRYHLNILFWNNIFFSRISIFLTNMLLLYQNSLSHTIKHPFILSLLMAFPPATFHSVVKRDHRSLLFLKIFFPALWCTNWFNFKNWNYFCIIKSIPHCHLIGCFSLCACFASGFVNAASRAAFEELKPVDVWLRKQMP